MLSLLLLISDDFVCSLENEGKEVGEWRESEVEVQSEMWESMIMIGDERFHSDWEFDWIWFSVSVNLYLWIVIEPFFLWLSDDWRVYVKWFMIPEFEGEGLVTYEFSL